MSGSVYQQELIRASQDILTNFRAAGDSVLGFGASLARSINGYIPPQWGKELVMVKAITRTSMTITKNLTKTDEEREFDEIAGGFGVDPVAKQVSETFFFDAVISELHQSSLSITQHPVQSGANITDHSFMQPKELTLEIKMSDVMGSFMPGQYSNDSTKSISAFNKFCELQEARSPLVIQTRLKKYTDMLIEQITTPDDKETTRGLKCTIKFKEIIVGDIEYTGVRSRPHTGGIGSGGSKKAADARTLGSILYEAGVNTIGEFFGYTMTGRAG